MHVLKHKRVTFMWATIIDYTEWANLNTDEIIYILYTIRISTYLNKDEYKCTCP